MYILYIHSILTKWVANLCIVEEGRMFDLTLTLSYRTLRMVEGRGGAGGLRSS